MAAHRTVEHHVDRHAVLPFPVLKGAQIAVPFACSGVEHLARVAHRQDSAVGQGDTVARLHGNRCGDGRIRCLLPGRILHKGKACIFRRRLRALGNLVVVHPPPDERGSGDLFSVLCGKLLHLVSVHVIPILRDGDIAFAAPGDALPQNTFLVVKILRLGIHAEEL